MKKLFVLSMFLFSSASFAEVCFNANLIRSWEFDQATQALMVRASHDFYKVATAGCFDFDRAQGLGFRTFFGSQVCRGDTVVLFDAFNRVIDECHITSITR